MPKINFTDKELEHLRVFYTAELASTEEYIANITSILAKLDADDISNTRKEKAPAKPKKKPGRPKRITIESATQDASRLTSGGKRGRKAKVKAEQVISEVPLNAPAKRRGRPPRAKVDEPLKAKEKKPRGKRGKYKPRKPKIQPILSSEQVTGENENENPIIPTVVKPKQKRKGKYRHHSVFLSNWSKPV